ncbi:MAG: MBL fold metallo-hydrolase [bacterium]
MQNKPYVWVGRFYNHSKDSISLRLFRAARCFAGKIARKAVRKKYECDIEFTPANWAETAKVSEHSHNPVITWIGHSTFLIQVGGINIITDPVFFNLSFFAPRVLKAGISIDQLPKIDFVIVSHNHMDHMDLRSIKMLNAKFQSTFLVPHGNKKWLEQKGIKNVIEKKWWEEQVFDIPESDASQGDGSTSSPRARLFDGARPEPVEGCEFQKRSDSKFTFLPAVHWTSRGILDINKTMWGSWMIEHAGFKIYFAGDTAYADHFEKIGKIFHGIDIALMPIGPVQPRKLINEAHTCPMEAVRGFLDLDAKCFIPMHWGTFRSAYESFSSPALGLLNSWKKFEDRLNGKSLKLLKVGESILFEQK